MGSFGRNIDGKEVVEKTKVRDKPWGTLPPLFKLNDCQRCGAKQADKDIYTAFYGFLKDVGSGWKVVCKKCGNDSDRFYKYESDAVKKWNEGDEQ